jgi:dTMP kinase
VGERLRELVLDPATGDIDPATEALIYAASRAELVAREIEPALAAGRVVLLDRYVDSSLAYQGAGRQLGIDRVLEANLLATRGRLPHRTIFVDVPTEVASERLADAGAPPDRLEAAGNEFFARVRDAYVALAERWPERIVRIDGTASPEVIARRVAEELAPVFAGAGIDLAATTEARA